MIILDNKIISWLLEEENPSIRYFALTSLIGCPPDAPEVIQAEKAIMERGAVPAILAKQSTDGSWSVPEKFYTDKYKGTVWVLLLLAALGVDPQDERVKKACEFIFCCSQEPESGGFSVEQSAKTGTGLPSYVIPCLTGNMAYALIRLGYADDPRLQKALKWITDIQRADDGTDGVPKGQPYDRFEICWGRHTCHMGAAKTLKALAEVPPGNRSPEIIKKTQELSEYFLLHHLYKKSHNLSEVAKPGWLKLGFPLMYQTDILELLEMFAQMKIKDGRLLDAVNILKSKQTGDGVWLLENSYNGKTLVNIEQKGKPSKWITFKALKVLKNMQTFS